MQRQMQPVYRGMRLVMPTWRPSRRYYTAKLQFQLLPHSIVLATLIDLFMISVPSAYRAAYSVVIIHVAILSKTCMHHAYSAPVESL